MSVYADTSFLVSLYVLDVYCSRATARMKEALLPILVTPLGRLELLNALSLRLFRKELTLSQTETGRSLFEADVTEGIFILRSLPAAVYERAAAMSRRHTPKLGTRTLDVLHVASAVMLNAHTFYTFDRRQRTLAKREALIVP